VVRVILAPFGFIGGNADVVQGVLFFFQPVDLFGDQVGFKLAGTPANLNPRPAIAGCRLSLGGTAGNRTGLLKWAIRKYLAQAQNPKIHHGKQTVKQLVSQGAGVQNIEITGKNIKSFERVARKYGVDFALKKDPAQGKYLVFFKARDADALNAAFAEYAGKSLNRSAQKKPSLLGQLSHFKEIAKNLTRDTAKNREKGGVEL